MENRNASGPFDVHLEPQPLGFGLEGSGVARMSLAKRFHGDLEATSHGEMLALRDAMLNSGGYVALEVVRGTLHGRSGGFVLQHSSTMTRGVPGQSITVVPDSGTGELAGITGRMLIDIAADGAHSYRFEYAVPLVRRAGS
jgi:hypothetical protein